MEGIMAKAKKLIHKPSIAQIEQLGRNDYKNKIVQLMYTIKPITVVEYCCGMFKFRLKDGELRQPNWIMKTVTIFYILTFIIVYVKNFLRPHVMVNTATRSGRVLQEVPSVTLIIHYIISILQPCFPANSMLNIRILTTFADLDEMLHVEKFNEYYKKSRSQTNFLVSALLFVHVANFIFYIMNETDVLWAIIVFHLYLIQKLEILTFIKYIIMVKCRLTIINKYISKFVFEQDQKHVVVFTVRDMKKEPHDKYDFIGRVSGNNAKIRDLATMYDTIGKICFMINRVFNLKILMILVTAFGYILMTIRTALTYYQKPGYYTSDLATVIIWCLNVIGNLLALTFACEILLRERSKTKKLVNKIIMNYDLPKTMRVQAKAFMEFLEAWSLQIYVYDMFSVDITLILKFISVATTYLIVIIQVSHLI